MAVADDGSALLWRDHPVAVDFQAPEAALPPKNPDKDSSQKKTPLESGVFLLTVAVKPISLLVLRWWLADPSGHFPLQSSLPDLLPGI